MALPKHFIHDGVTYLVLRHRGYAMHTMHVTPLSLCSSVCLQFVNNISLHYYRDSIDEDIS